MPDPRTEVMTLVEVSWQDEQGARQTVPARMENKSIGGACIRVKTPIGVGSKLNIQWRWEQFSGSAKYCRSEGKEYRVGIQRDATYTLLPESASTKAAARGKLIQTESRVTDGKIEDPGLPQKLPQMETQPAEIALVPPNLETASRVAPASPAPAPSPRAAVAETRNKASPRAAQPQNSGAVQPTDRQTQAPLKRKEPAKERKRMQRNWLGLPNWASKDDLTARAAAGEENQDRGSEDGSPARKPAVDCAGESGAYVQVELLPTEEIYLAAGIVNPRKGYSINKVVEMLHSEYVRALPKEMKRAAVLMALDAAGIPIEQIQQDAKARRDALNTYEAAQKKQAEAEWLRKTEENAQVQAELERVKGHYMARISRNQEEVAREKARFTTWLASKQQEIQSMAEAVELCLTPVAAEPATNPRSEMSRTELPKVEAKSEATTAEAIKPEAQKSDAGAKPVSDPANPVHPEVSLAKAAVAGKPV